MIFFFTATPHTSELIFGECNNDVTTCSLNADCVETEEIIITSQTEELAVTSHYCRCRDGFRGNGTYCEGWLQFTFLYRQKKNIHCKVINYLKNKQIQCIQIYIYKVKVNYKNRSK